MKYLFSVVFIWMIAVGASAQNDLSGFLSAADSFFKKYTQDGKVNYAAIAGNKADMDKLIQYLAKAPVGQFSQNEKTAFYINAYNILVIRQVIEAVRNSGGNSAQSISGFFDTNRQSVGGEELTLNEIEKQKLILPIQDPRMHFVLVCAAKGCPKIADFAFMPEQLDEQLTQRTRAALDDPEFIRVKDSEKKIEISEIFTWYQDDFLKKYASIEEFINLYRSEKLNPDYELSKYTYDWSLNNR